MLWTIVLLEDPAMPKPQLPHRQRDVLPWDFMVLDGVHLAFHTLQFSSVSGSKAARDYHQPTTMLLDSLGVLFRIYFILPPFFLLCWSETLISCIRCA